MEEFTMTKVIFLNNALLTCFILVSYGNSYDENTVYRQALLTIRIKEKEHAKEIVLYAIGKYAKQSPHSIEIGYLYHAGSNVTWCKQTIGIDKISTPWIALIPRENKSYFSLNTGILTNTKEIRLHQICQKHCYRHIPPRILIT